MCMSYNHLSLLERTPSLLFLLAWISSISVGGIFQLLCIYTFNTLLFYLHWIVCSAVIILMWFVKAHTCAAKCFLIHQDPQPPVPDSPVAVLVHWLLHILGWLVYIDWCFRWVCTHSVTLSFQSFLTVSSCGLPFCLAQLIHGSLITTVSPATCWFIFVPFHSVIKSYHFLLTAHSLSHHATDHHTW